METLVHLQKKLKTKTPSGTCLQCALFRAGVQLEVLYTDGCDYVAFTARVAGTVREYDLIVAFTTPQQIQILRGERDELKQ